MLSVLPASATAKYCRRLVWSAATGRRSASRPTRRTRQLAARNFPNRNPAPPAIVPRTKGGKPPYCGSTRIDKAATSRRTPHGLGPAAVRSPYAGFEIRGHFPTWWIFPDLELTSFIRNEL